MCVAILEREAHTVEIDAGCATNRRRMSAALSVGRLIAGRAER
jgi:hypothetical protein